MFSIGFIAGLLAGIVSISFFSDCGFILVFRRCSSTVERLSCKQIVGGSSPSACYNHTLYLR